LRANNSSGWIINPDIPVEMYGFTKSDQYEAVRNFMAPKRSSFEALREAYLIRMWPPGRNMGLQAHERIPNSGNIHANE